MQFPRVKVSIDGVDATKTTYVSTTKVTALLDSHSPSATTYYLKVSTEYGSVTGLSPVTFTGVVEVSPAVGNASTATGVHLTGTNFNTYNATGWATGTGGAAIKYLVAFVPGGITIAATNDLTTATYTNVKYCTTILVDSDTSLSCQTPATLTGAYSVQLLLIAADDTVTTVISVPARAATFTAADL